jgi:hypothetical protein
LPWLSAKAANSVDEKHVGGNSASRYCFWGCTRIPRNKIFDRHQNGLAKQRYCAVMSDNMKFLRDGGRRAQEAAVTAIITLRYDSAPMSINADAKCDAIALVKLKITPA